jgi:hypothetical protein
LRFVQLTLDQDARRFALNVENLEHFLGQPAKIHRRGDGFFDDALPIAGPA